MVLQDGWLFAGTVRENILYGRPDATEEEMLNAAELAGAHHAIERLPHGYDTVLVESGANLSQGQRQLIAIARAVLAAPRSSSSTRRRARWTPAPSFTSSRA